MALWGITDAAASTPKIIARTAYFNAASATVINLVNDTIDISASGTGFATGDAVKYDINGGTTITGYVNGTTYFVRVVGAGVIELYDTYAHAIAFGSTTGRSNTTVLGAGSHFLKRTGAANVYGDRIQRGSEIVFVDSQEASTTANKAKGLNSPGWWLYRTYTDGNSKTRYKTELLIAIANTAVAAGDQEDTIAADMTLTITGQPTAATVTAPAAATFTVTATTNAASGLSYQWQIQQSGVGAWADIVGATTASYTTGVTSIAPGIGASDTDKFLCKVSAGGLTVASNSVILTVN